MFELPTKITINGEQFNIRNNGDYRVILDCFAVLQDVNLSKEERLEVALIIFYECLNDVNDIFIKLPDIEVAVKEMYKFFSCGREDNNTGTKTNYRLVDWQEDEQLIASAINSVANTEIRAISYVHWWTFLGYYSAIGECPFSTIISIRYKIAKGKPLEQHEKEYRRENPQYFNMSTRTIEQQEADALARQLWNSQ